MSRAEGFMLFLSEGEDYLQTELSKTLSTDYNGVSAVVSRSESGDTVVTFSNGEDESEVVFASIDGVPSAIIPDEEDEEEFVVSHGGGSGYGSLVRDAAFLDTVLGLSGIIDIEDDEEDDDEEDDDEEDDDEEGGELNENPGSPDAYGYANEGVVMGAKKAKFVIRGGKKKKVFVRKRKMKMKGSERRARKIGAKKAARKRRSKKAVMARKRKKSLKIRGRMHLKALKGWRKR